MEKIDLKSVKIALERDEMLEIAGGSGGWNCAAGIAGGFLAGMASSTGNGVAFALG